LEKIRRNPERVAFSAWVDFISCVVGACLPFPSWVAMDREREILTAHWFSEQVAMLFFLVDGVSSAVDDSF